MKTNIRNARLHSKSVPREQKDIEVPWLNLSGQWLTKAGFNIGDEISIIVKHNYLRITKTIRAPKAVTSPK